MNNLARALTQVGHLKTLKRTGWVRSGLVGTESVADHSFRAAVLALVLGRDLGEGVDTGRLLKMVLVHDLPESDPTVGDLTPHCGVDRVEKHRRERVAMERLCSGVAGGEELLSLWREYEDGSTREADLAHQIDALEMALTAREYEQRHGADLSEFVASARHRVRHPRLLELIDGG